MQEPVYVPFTIKVVIVILWIMLWVIANFSFPTYTVEMQENTFVYHNFLHTEA